MKTYNQSKIFRSAIALVLGFFLAKASAMEIKSDQANFLNWQFTDGVTDIVDPTMISVMPSINGVPPIDSTYSGNGLQSDKNYNGYWTASMKIDMSNMPTGVEQRVDVAINLFTADDRAQLLFIDSNGKTTLLDSAGLFASNSGVPGYFQASYNGADTPVTYYSGNTFGSDCQTIYDDGNCPPSTYVKFTKGINYVEVIINNTDDGIFGQSLTTGGPTHFTLDSDFNLPSWAKVIPTVTEPDSLVLIITGSLSFLIFRGGRKLNTIC